MELVKIFLLSYNKFPFHSVAGMIFQKNFWKLFLWLRIYYSLKFANQKFASARKKDRKYIKVAHL